MKQLQLLILSFIIVLSGYSQNKDSIMVKKIVEEIMLNANAFNNLRILCKDVGARNSGSENFNKAVEVTRQMLKDAGAERVYLQPCLIPHWVRGKKEEGNIILNNGKKLNLRLLALGFSVATPAAGLSGKVIEIRDLAELEEKASLIKGNIVFFNNRMNPTHINTFRAYGESAKYRTTGPALAAKYGATGALVRSMAININDVPHTGVTFYNDSFPQIPAAAISTLDAEILSRELKNKNVRSAWFRMDCKTYPKVTGYNVIGEIKGSQFTEEIITVGGHLDSWDVGEGANDDGSGIVQSIEIIRAFKALNIQPKRTIRAVLFADEEMGGGGSDAYLESAKSGNEKHIFALESDAGGFTPRAFGVTATDEKWNQILEWKPLFYPYGVYEFWRGGGGADVGPLREIGTTIAGLTPDSQRYFDIHHAATDVFENVSERELNLGAANMAAFIFLVSEYGL